MIIIKYTSSYLIVGINKENYGFPNKVAQQKAICNSICSKYWP